ncbi:MAG: sulfite exporter TauE/SafE family protein [Pseudomonadota bacterium]
MISIFQFDLAILLAIFAIMLFAGLVHGTLGLGFPMVATPMLATMMDVRSAILITLLPTVAVNLVSIFRSPSGLERLKPFHWLIGFSLAGSIIGSLVLAISDPAPFRLMLAGLILLYLWNSLRISRLWLNDNSRLAMLVFGLIAGFSAGTTNVMVAILIIYFLSLETPRENMVPALNACFFVGKASQIIVFSIVGLVGLMHFIETLPLALSAVLALRAGQYLHHRIDLKTYQSILKKLLAVLAAILIFQFLNETKVITNISTF